MTMSFVFTHLFCLMTNYINIIPLNCKITFSPSDPHNNPCWVRTGNITLLYKIGTIAERI